MAITVRTLCREDYSITEAFLATTPDSTLFLRSNLARGGIVDDGATFSGTYAGAFDGERMVGLAAMCWNTNVIVAPGPHAERLALHASVVSGKRVGGILGPHAEVVRVRAALGLEAAATRFDSKEILYALPLASLVLPEALASGRVIGRRPRQDELDGLLEWRMRSSAEMNGLPDTPDNRAEQRRYLDVLQDNGLQFLVTVDDAHVGYSAFNAALPEIVQVGGVWTPPGLRGRGYARCCVAWSLADARGRGVRRAVLFTGESNRSAQVAYEAIGFRPVGDYATVHFA